MRWARVGQEIIKTQGKDELGKVDASAAKAEASPSVEVLKLVVKRPDKKRRRERWPEDLAVEQEVIEPEEVKEDRDAFRCIGEEDTEILGSNR